MRKNLSYRHQVPAGLAPIAETCRRVYRSTSVTVLALSLLAMMLLACQRQQESHDVYTCPMHPTVISDKPGTCPVCHMDLVRKVPGAEVAIDDELAAATESPDRQVMSSIHTVRGEFTSKSVTIKRTGVVSYDARNRSTVSARVAGRLEKVFVRYAFQHVRKGEKIADIYSPELAAAQREWLYVQRTDPGNESILRASRQRLLNMGMTDSQIDQVTARKEAGYSVPLYSPAEGIVVQRGGQAPAAPVAPPSSTSADMGGPASMNAPTASQTAQANDNTTGEDLLREGAYVAAGQPLFEVVRISSLLLEVNLPATAIAYVRKGDKLKASTRNKTVTASVDLIQPFAQAGEPFVKVRSYLPDTAGLTVGELVTATFEMPAVEGLWLPASAVYDLGTRKVAFVKHGQHFTAVEVETGVAADQQIMVISGVASADEVAADAQFLIDNEGFIKTL